MTVDVQTPRAVYLYSQNVDYPVTFSYLEKEDVRVTVVDENSKETRLQQGVDWEFSDSQEVHLLNEYTTTDSIVIFRQTTPDQETAWEADVRIEPTILEYDFDKLTLLVQELLDDKSTTVRMPLDFTGDEPVLDPELLNKVILAADEARLSAEEAEASAEAAAISETYANSSAANAEVDANRAEAAADRAESAADLSEQYANNAEQSEINAGQSEANAAASEAAAAASAASALNSAVRAEAAAGLPDITTAQDGDVMTAVDNGGVLAPAWRSGGATPIATPSRNGLVPSGGQANQVYKVNAAGSAYGFEDMSVPVVNDASTTAKGVAYAATQAEVDARATNPSRAGVPAFVTPEQVPVSGGGGIPAGVIVIWSGAVANIPQDWALCDGTNGTPDLRDRFVVGAGGGYAVGVMGGSSTSGATTLATSQIPGHTHSLGTFCWTGNNNSLWHSNGGFTASCGYEEGNNGVRNAQSAGGGGSHTHTVTPPYYALAYIMKL